MPVHGLRTATQIALALYTAYNIAATVISFPAGKMSDRLGDRGPLLVVGAGVVTFLLAYILFAITGPMIVVLAIAFVAAGIGIGCAETAEHAAVAALAPEHLRGSAFGLLATVQAGGNLIASALAGLLYSVASPAVAFGYVAACMALALVGLAWSSSSRRR
jgi:MFS family permease